MRGSLQESIPLLQQDTVYARLFAQAYSTETDVISQYNIANAIASFIRSLVALNARFDKHMRGDSTQLSATEKNGFNLFMGKAKCGTCHFMPLYKWAGAYRLYRKLNRKCWVYLLPMLKSMLY